MTPGPVSLAVAESDVEDLALRKLLHPEAPSLLQKNRGMHHLLRDGIYDPKFIKSSGARPISAFPDFQEEYRREDLWPFFSVRLPPVDREDVRRVLEERHIPESDVLRILAEVSSRGVSSPYRFSLAGSS